MANARELKERMASIQETKKITNAMYLISSSKMKQAKKKLGKALFDLFRGGVFADGGLLSYSRQIKCLPVKVYPEVYGESSKVTIHSYEGVVYKYSILVRDKE